MSRRSSSRVAVLGAASVVAAAAGLALPSGASAVPYLGYCNDSPLTFNTPYSCTRPGTYDISLPAGSRSIAVDLQGGGGGGAPSAGSMGGNAARVQARNIQIPDGTTRLRVIVAGGGYASRASFKSGGGASAIIALDAGGAVKAKLVIAGGGGGGAKDGAGGDAGYPGTATNSKVVGGRPGDGPTGGLGGMPYLYTAGAPGQSDSQSLPSVALGGVGPYAGEQAGNGGAGYGGGGSGSLAALGDTYVAGGGGGSSFLAADARNPSTTIAISTRGKAGRDGLPGFATFTLNEPWAPSAVVNPTYTPSYTSLSVLFHKPFNDGGSPITGYLISLDAGRTWQSLAYTGPAGGPYRATVNGLTRGRTYQLRMQAFNSIGYGDALAPTAVTTRTLGPPSVPVGLQVTPGTARGSLNLLWHKPFEDGGTAILGYRVSLNGGATWQPPLTVRGPASGPYTATVNGLVSGRTYSVRIQAWNAQGYGGAPAPVPGTAR